MKTIYFIKSGNNGATYIFNTKDIVNIKSSLKFYKAFTIRQKVVKTLLFSLVLVKKIFKKSSLKSVDEIVTFLKESTSKNIDFLIDENCSILISPTRDKIIVHNHKKSRFDKYAFGKSLDGVKNEHNIYKLLNKETKYFNTSKIENFYSDENYCSFSLLNRLFTKKSENIVDILVEFFTFDIKEVAFKEYFDNSFKNLDNELEKYSHIIKNMYKNQTVKIGLVHKDFKPWNMAKDQGPLIYDFEESCRAFAGEDLLNYYIDPIVSYKSIEEIKSVIHSDELQKQITSYKNKLDLSISIEMMLLNYLFERTYFWNNKNQKDLASKYKELLKGFLNE